MFVICDICQCEISSADLYDYHINGKRHQIQLRRYQTRRDEAMRSVYVRGFPPATQEHELLAYFSMFGPVGKIIYDEKKSAKTKVPAFAIVEFVSPDTVKTVTIYGQHVINSQHIEIRPRSFKELRTEPYFPWQRQENNKDMPWNRYQNNFEKLAAKNIQMGPYESYNTYQPKGKKAKGPKPVKQGRAKDSEGQDIIPIQLEEFRSYLTEHQCVGIQTQMMLLVELTQVTALEFQYRYTICKTLEDALTPFFPGMTVNQFGSSVNGFGIKGCDMDIFIDLSKLGIPCRTGNVTLPFVKDLYTLKKKAKAPLTQSDVDGMRNMDKLKLIQRILTEHAPTCMESQIVPSQRCPILRFTDYNSQIKCDLSINNKLALQNTRLLQTFSLYDARIKPLVYTIRYWAKVKDIAGNPKASNRLSSYALTMLVIYYLMNTTPPVLPPVEELARMCGRERTIIDQWDCSFVSAQFMPPTTNIQTIEELLHGFFQYFGNFDFLSNPMSVRTGKPMTLTRAVLEKTLKVGSMILQDPFVLDHNITQNVNSTMVIKIIKEMNLAEAKAVRWFDVAYAETKSIMDILGNEIPEGFEVKKIKLKNPMSEELGPYQMLIRMNLDKLSRPDIQALEASGNMRLSWCKKMMVFLYRLIERSLMFDCDLADVTLPVNLKSSRNYSIYRSVSKPIRPAAMNEEEQESQEYTEDNQEDGGDQMTGETSQAPEGNLSEGQNRPSTSEEYHQSSDYGNSASGSTMYDNSADDEEYKDNQGWAPAGKGPTSSTTVDGTELVPVVDPMDEDEEEEEERRKQEEEERLAEEEDRQNDPSYIQYDFQDSEYHIDMDVKVMCRIWVERKNVMKELKERGFRENLQLEQTVSERLFYEVHGPMKWPVTQFRCVLRSIVTDNGASVLLDCMADPRQKEYDCIFHYMKKFIIKSVDKFFYA
ncbi:poly(A) RNA polymerase, mitochondrial-like [Saccostrea echinata]|uniref:poly(A) RNA polymerase, mitochondrial-like n=1 Tax=Saccostrea echinata TaxID=191078 RepID=UPI002A7FA1F0|nr:poly(A) RNA polymerase, mitochondrial-like [Saccostrea echinata]